MFDPKTAAGVPALIKLETETELTFDGPPAGRVNIKKSAIVQPHFGASVMPGGFDKTLTKRQLRDLVEFLAQLK